ncbi:MAG: hybrid sensor histidine kinase/response regulator [Leptolyngbyaceae cyanobacterium T60_A2020_046]|nr:hybrid sensor histidine kinase/response regulator [Leptolyngbyaceae cyanobacterium T60_A2020_046]
MMTPAPQLLVVDDSLDNRFLLQTLLEEEGYQVNVLENGQATLDYLEHQLPDLILLDVMMPGLSGYEVTRHIREQAHIPFIPILLITAHERSDVVEGLDAGADDFIRKPFDVDELLARVRALLRLKHSVDAEREMAQQRDDFVSRLTHDLRTPLVAANRMLTLVNQGAFGEITPDAKTAIAQTIRNNENLLSMVNTLLEVYRHEAGRKTMSFAPFNLITLLEEVMAELRPLAEEKHLELKQDVHLMADQPTTLVGDRLELRRVFINLIGNAIKFTDAGFVRVQVTQTYDAHPAPQWQIDIQDTGAGIAPAEQREIFAWFRSGNHRRSGSGLGLHLAQRIVTAHAGTLTVQSALGEGSTFTVCLPVMASESAG